MKRITILLLAVILATVPMTAKARGERGENSECGHSGSGDPAQGAGGQEAGIESDRGCANNHRSSTDPGRAIDGTGKHAGRASAQIRRMI